VLTKPDLIHSNLEDFQKLFHNETMHLASGWYITKNPESRKISWEESRKEEQAFFSEPPWSSETSEYLSRLGTENLANALSKLLHQRISQWFVSISYSIDKVFLSLRPTFARFKSKLRRDFPSSLCRLRIIHKADYCDSLRVSLRQSERGLNPLKNLGEICSGLL
jgi:Dynamin central region